MSESPGVFVWAKPEHEALIRGATSVAGLAIVGVGGTTSDAASALGHALDVPFSLDRRLALQSAPDVVWLLTGPDLGDEERRTLAGQETVVAAGEPDLRSDDLRRPDDLETILVPRFRTSPGVRLARETISEFGLVSAAHVTCLGRASHGSLFARLHDAFDLVAALGLEIASVYASGAGAEAAETLAGMQGALGAAVRTSDGRGASVLASDRAGGWLRRAELVGPSGTLVLDDAGYAWTDMSGLIVDAGRSTELPEEPDDVTIAARLAGLALDRLLRGVTEPAPPVSRRADPIAACEAARISARTGEAESPDRCGEVLRDLAGG